MAPGRAAWMDCRVLGVAGSYPWPQLVFPQCAPAMHIAGICESGCILWAPGVCFEAAAPTSVSSQGTERLTKNGWGWGQAEGGGDIKFRRLKSQRQRGKSPSPTPARSPRPLFDVVFPSPEAL